MEASSLDGDRVRKLRKRLLSGSVQVSEQACLEKVPAKLDDAEVRRVFMEHVPGVEGFLFRQEQGNYALRWIVVVYRDGVRAFRGTPVHKHLKRLMRIIVHHCHTGGEGAANHLRDIAEAFMDCQAVQARIIERVGLRICGVVQDFKGLVTRFVGEYKTLAVQMLAAERLAQGQAHDHDQVPTHYENRLIADLGQQLGLDANAVRMAALDGHASKRFRPIFGAEADAAVERCRELFDTPAMLQAFVAEVNSFSAESPPESMAAMFLTWASENLTEKHAVLDEATCSQTDINSALAICVFEVLFLNGTLGASAEEVYRGTPVHNLFKSSEAIPGNLLEAGTDAEVPDQSSTEVDSANICRRPARTSQPRSRSRSNRRSQKTNS